MSYYPSQMLNSKVFNLLPLDFFLFLKKIKSKFLVYKHLGK